MPDIVNVLQMRVAHIMQLTTTNIKRQNLLKKIKIYKTLIRHLANFRATFGL